MTKQTDPAKASADLSDEIQQAMDEAEAAVTALDEDDLQADASGATGLAAAVVELETELQQTKDRWLRAVADLENYKKRVKREVDEASTSAVQRLLPAFLPTVDNLERALEVSGPGASVEQLVRGIQMVRDEFLAALRKHGIEPVPSVGTPFDPTMHDALQQIDSPEHAPGVVVREFERGYRFGERLLRPARVIIAGPGSTGAPGEGAKEA